MIATPPGLPDPAQWISSLTKDPARLAALQSAYLEQQARLWAAMLGGGADPLVRPEAGDRRFAAKEWQDNPYFSYLKQSYLLAVRFLADLAENADLDAAGKERLRFAVKQWCDALSPANFAATNPAVLREALETKGESGNAQLFASVEGARRERERAYDETLAGWSLALEMRDEQTNGHTERVTRMTVALAEAMGVASAELPHIRRGALLHDIGKMVVPDRILHKDGGLSPEEWAIMRRHPEHARLFLDRIDYLAPALDIPYCHHERWDGTGYPRGLRGQEIPLAARSFAVVDVFDALTSDRPQRPAWARPAVIEHLRSEAGRHFDPAVVEVFLAILPRLVE